MLFLLITLLICHFAEYCLEANYLSGHKDRSARIASLLEETQ